MTGWKRPFAASQAFCAAMDPFNPNFVQSAFRNCPFCGIALENDFLEAGKPDHCPGCSRPFVVPGKKELDEVSATEHRATQEKVTVKLQAERAAAATASSRSWRKIKKMPTAVGISSLTSDLTFINEYGNSSAGLV